MCVVRTRAPGVAANCASALAQMAAASCVQEEREEKEVGETGDAIAQGSADTHTVSPNQKVIWNIFLLNKL